MNLEDLDYELPPGRIAQIPTAERDGSALLVLDRATGDVRHRIFRELAEELSPGDLLVVNDTRVRPARLRGTKRTGGRVEVLLLEPEGEPGRWICLLDASRTPKAGSEIVLPGGLTALVEGRSGSTWTVRLTAPGGEDPRDLVETHGEIPLPPYIRRDPDDPRSASDRTRYQTVYARVTGSAAAPTAGLHFTPELIDALADKGIGQARVTLHVGLGTFLPLREDAFASEALHEEAFVVPRETVDAVEQTRRAGGRIVAVGTTTVRALESAVGSAGRLEPAAGRTRLFIRPGYSFRIVDAMVTNFHLPRSSLLALVFAFAGRERVLAAYREAIDRGYRFYSYGDAMLVVTG